MKSINFKLIFALTLASICSSAAVAEDRKKANYYAGVVAYSTDDDGDVVLLFGEEPRADVRPTNTNPQGFRWKAMGGKPNKKDADKAATAAREFNEETRGVYSNAGFNIIDHLNDDNMFKHARHDAYIFLIKVEYINIDDFNKAPKDDHTEMNRYAWVKLKTLLDEADRLTLDPKFKGTVKDKEGREIPLARFHLYLTDETISGNRRVYPNTYDFLLDSKSRKTLDAILKDTQ